MAEAQLVRYATDGDVAIDPMGNYLENLNHSSRLKPHRRAVLHYATDCNLTERQSGTT